MSEDEEALTAISLGFPPYRRSPLKSKSYEVIFQFLSLCDQQNLFEVQKAQEKEETCLSKNDLLAENEKHSVDVEEPALNSPMILLQQTGQKAQEKEETCFSKNNLLVDYEEHGVEEPALNSPMILLQQTGQKAQEKEETCLSKNNLLVDYEEHSVEEPALNSPMIGVQQTGQKAQETQETEYIVQVEEPTFNSPIMLVEKRSLGGSVDSIGNLITGLKQSLLEEPVDDKEDRTQVSMMNVVGDRVMKDPETEEGEISGDMGEMKLSENQVLDGAVDIDNCNQEEMQTPRDKPGVLPAICTEPSRTCQREMVSYEFLVDMVSPNECSGPTDRGVKKAKRWSKQDNSIHLGAIAEKAVNKNEGKKASAKENRRRKRAEEDKRSGVKRLKLQPNTKPKNPCKYYLSGRCQQGDSCKFSHDITPLTKNEPCKFLATHKCLKGADCPFDHELSKYPCDNYKSNGYCYRGDACLFSHKIPVVGSSSPSSDINKKAQEISLLPNSANSGKQPHKGSISQILNMYKNMTPPTPASPGTITRQQKQSVADIAQPAQAPKGINFLSFGKSPRDNSSEQQKIDLPAVGCSLSQGTSVSIPKPSEISGRIPASTVSSSPPSKMIGQRQDKNKSAWKPQSRIMDRPVQSTASNVNVPTISNILQEFLFNGQ